MQDVKYPDYTENSLKVLNKRYTWDINGTKETPDALFMRVASFIAGAEQQFERRSEQFDVAQKFYDLMRSFRFMPNTPTLTNAGRPNGQLAACYVLPMGDSMEEIMDALKSQALVQKSGGGCGFDFGPIRERNSLVKSTGMKAAGPIPIIKLMNFMMSEFIVQGGIRSGANMGVLPVDHCDIFEFIKFKHDDGACASFNVSIGATDVFMQSIKNDDPWNLISRVDNKPKFSLSAKSIFNLATQYAWETGDPGMLFLDTINKSNPTPHLGRLRATNPCAEQALLPNEACTLGHLNLPKYMLSTLVKCVSNIEEFKYMFNVHQFIEDIKIAIRFLDNVIEVNTYAVKEMETMHRKTNRKVGLGVMGLHDLLIMCEIPYDSQLARDVSFYIASTMRTEADSASCELAKWRGNFGSFKDSPLSGQFTHMRNACRTNVAPTGSTAIICGSSTGIEPEPFLILERNQAGMTMYDMNPLFKKEIDKLDRSEQKQVIDYYNAFKSIIGCDIFPERIQHLYAQANDVSIDGHIGMQAVWQSCVDNAVSKTINMKSSATVEDVRYAYTKAWESGCKGITIYRDGCRNNQPLSASNNAKGPVCPECGATMTVADGCMTCYSCGYSKCSVTKKA